MALDHLFERVDLSGAFAAAVLLGAVLAVYLMQVSWQSDIERGDPTWLRYLRRTSLMGLALAFIWALSYSLSKNWQPWPPFLAVVVSADLYLAVRVITLHLRQASARRDFSRSRRLASNR
jgi:hypothetical protein